jgi:hypothetical protein
LDAYRVPVGGGTPRPSGDCLMRTLMDRGTRSGQRGWLGLAGILVAVVIVALLAKEAFKRYGLAPGAALTSNASKSGESARAPGAASGVGDDVAKLPSTPGSALNRARGVEEMVKQQADERAAQADAAAK